MASLQQWWKGFLTCNLLALSFSAATPFPIVSCRPCEPSLGEKLVCYTQNLPLLSVGVPYVVGEQEQEVGYLLLTAVITGVAQCLRV